MYCLCASNKAGYLWRSLVNIEVFKIQWKLTPGAFQKCVPVAFAAVLLYYAESSLLQ